MTRTTFRSLAALAAVTVLTACGNASEESGDPVQIAARMAGDLFSDGEPEAPQSQVTAAAQGGLTRAKIEASPTPLMIAAVPSRDARTLVALTGQNGPETTWFAEDNISVTFENGLLVATRGFGPDLMGADVSGVSRALRAGGGTATRVHEYLDGADQIIRREYACQISPVGQDPVTIYERTYQTIRYTEACRSGDVEFTNQYWVDASGAIWKSRQLVSPPLGYLDSVKL